MEKDVFLRHLAQELRFYLPQADREAVLRDYAEYFDSAHSAGEGDSEVCARLGSPTVLAREIRSAGGSKSLPLLRTAATWLYRQPEPSRWPGLLSLLPLLLGFFICIQAKGWIFPAYLWSVFFNQVPAAPLHLVGPAAVGTVMLFFCGSFSLCLSCLIWSRQNASLRRLYQLPLYLGACVTFLLFRRFLCWMGDSSHLRRLFLEALIPLCCGIILSTLLFIALTRRGKSYGRGV